MTSPTLSQIEQLISLLSDEEQLQLVERIIHYLRVNRTRNNLSNQSQTFEEQLSQMANDPAIQEELKTIERDFTITEMDGLT
jgi:oligoendopeptidase F